MYAYSIIFFVVLGIYIFFFVLGIKDILLYFFFVLGIKEYSNWPTIPQVFIGGEFVGGCDLMLEMHKNGELVEELQKVGIKSALLDKKDEKS